MLRPGPRNLITDVDGLAVGNAEDTSARTGVTVLLPAAPVVAAVDLRGGAPGTRDTELLAPENTVAAVHGIALSGGSVHGLEAGAGVTAWLARQRRGLNVRGVTVPIVPTAILFDLANGGDKPWLDGGAAPPYRDLAQAACDAAAAEFALGNAGAGLGACAGSLKGGLGSASLVDDAGLQVGAVAAVNSLGEAAAPGGTLWAAPFEQDGELGGQPPLLSGRPLDLDVATPAGWGGNTTLVAVATNADLDSAAAKRVAVMAQDGLARAVRPVHSPMDGDIVFVLSTATGTRPTGPGAVARLGSLAADCVARAVARGVFEAEPLGDMPSYRSLYGDLLQGRSTT
jgi:L-aminopeptidase/D-esterase-like protein